MRIFSLLLTLFLTTLPGLAQSPEERDVSELLDSFHQAASVADGDRYFTFFAPEGVFLGTDISERWSVEEFKAYAMPHFSQGRGWTYTPQERYISFSSDGRVAWFDETLKSENFGQTRGSGVLVRRQGQWKICQYNLTVPIPNDLLDEVVEMINATQSRGKN